MRSIWTGSVSFGLVNIPVRLYSATSGTGLDFSLLHKKDLSPIKYSRVCQNEGKEVPYVDIVKGYEYQKGEYVVIDDADFERASAKKTRTIDITEFVQEEEIDPLYYEKPYFLEPEKGAAKSYALLREALGQSHKVAIAKFVLRNREHLALIKPEGQVLALVQMRFQSELRTPSGLNLPARDEAKGREVQMALALIDQLTENFSPEDYHDTYTEELEKVIEAKLAGKQPAKLGQAPRPVQVGDLMAALKASLEQEVTRTPKRELVFREKVEPKKQKPNRRKS